MSVDPSAIWSSLAGGVVALLGNWATNYIKQIRNDADRREADIKESAAKREQDLRDREEDQKAYDIRYALLRDHVALAARLEKHEAEVQGRFEQFFRDSQQMHRDNQALLEKISSAGASTDRKVERILGKLEGTTGL